MFGCDLNPVAWFVVKNEMAEVDIEEVKRLLGDVEDEVKPQIMPYYACDGPNGEKGKWFRRTGTKERKRNPVQLDLTQGAQSSIHETEDEWEELPDIFDIFSVGWQDRKQYRYEGPEIIYTFWAKHGPCQREGCGHRTPILSSPVISVKTLTVGAWTGYRCPGCNKTFDVDRHAARMGRTAARVGDEFGVGPGVPQRPLRLHRAKRVKDAQPKSQRPGKYHCGGELLRRLAMQPAFGIPIDRPPR